MDQILSKKRLHKVLKYKIGVNVINLLYPEKKIHILNFFMLNSCGKNLFFSLPNAKNEVFIKFSGNFFLHIHSYF